jgi:hypothetical protein
MALADRKKRQVETLNDVKQVAEELTRKRLNEEFTLEDRAKFSNITAEGVTDGTLVSKAAEVNPAEPGQVNVELEARSANVSVDKKPEAKRTVAKK